MIFHGGWQLVLIFMVVGNAYAFSWWLATPMILLMVVGNAYNISWWLATRMTVMAVGNAYDFHGGWQSVCGWQRI